jgi:hypothetical protein
LWLAQHGKELKYANAIFPMIKGKTEGVDKIIMDRIRPTNNVLE